MSTSRSIPTAPAMSEAPSWELRSEKILPAHRERQAVVYVRQSSPQQVLNNQESTRLQYGLKTRAIQLGWPEDLILVIDDDLGKSGASAEGRAGFQRLVAEVTLGRIGIILGIEMSRLARSCRDWHQLLEVCALFGTLIADLDGVYDPANYNDRLLLGLKGTMSEAELHIIKQRMNQGRLAKARRGELVFPPPIGYVWRPTGELGFDPDEQVQSVVRLIFQKFDELGTTHAVLRYLASNGVQLGVRVRGGLAKGQIEWRRPTRATLRELLRNPLYAGAYAFGRRRVDPRRKKPGRPGTGRKELPSAQWVALLRDRAPAYISWERHEENLARLKSNQARAEERGSVRRGPALLSGLLICARCGYRLQVQYSGHPTRHVYVCHHAISHHGGTTCQSIAGAALDRFVADLALEALAPASLELSLETAKTLERERDQLAKLSEQRLERAAYEVDRAARQFRLVEPENRLVARQLEREWEEKLAAQRKVLEDIETLRRSQPRVLTEAEREAIRVLATDIPALWGAPSTTHAERKEILRQVLDRVVVDTQGESERVRVAIEWAGGSRTQNEMARPVRRLEQLSYFPRMGERLRQLVEEGLTTGEIAQRFNAEGLRPPKASERYQGTGIRKLMRRLGLSEDPSRSRSTDHAGLNQGEWWLAEVAARIPMPEMTLLTWIQRGWVRARQLDRPRRRWAVWADEKEFERLRTLHKEPVGQRFHWQWTAREPGGISGLPDVRSN